MRAALALADATRRLVGSKVVDAEVSARELLRAVLPREAQIGSANLTPQQLERLDTLLCRRERSEPLQYIVGCWDFRQLQGLEMRAPVLCPRPETEELAQLAEGVIQRRAESATPARPVNFLEVGCGTGAISISLLDNLAATLPRSRRAAVRGTAVDISHEAGELSLRNASRFGISAERCQPSGPAAHPDPRHRSEVLLRVLEANAFTLKLAEPEKVSGAEPAHNGWVELVVADHGDALCSDEAAADIKPAVEHCGARVQHAMQRRSRRRFDVLVANPPYIPNEDEALLHPQVRHFEDPRALFGGAPLGAGFTLALLERVARAQLLAAGGDVLLEVDSIHPALIADILQPCVGAASGAENGACPVAGTEGQPAASSCSTAATADRPCCKVRQLHSATGFALPRDGFDGSGAQAVISRDWALEKDWASRKPALDSPATVDRRLQLDDARAAWNTAVAELRPRLARYYNLERVLLDLYGRPRFVHLRAQMAARGLPAGFDVSLG